MVKANNTRKFHLKPFSLFHHQSTMKVGMDSILLGIWAEPGKSEKILDIGTGSGILSLLMACKSSAKISAIELDKDSAEEASLNFQISPFYNRLNLFEKDFIDFSGIGMPKYDAIISNPPFFVNDSRSENDRKSQARHGDSLSFGQLIEGVKKLLLPDGKFFLVLPYEESKQFLKQANNFGLLLHKQQLIFPVRGLQPNRVNMQFGFNSPKEMVTDKLVIREEDRSFTEDYKNFVREFLIAV
jgi:tRNA1Val (adenine37-N6)-methyltransferase